MDKKRVAIIAVIGVLLLAVGAYFLNAGGIKSNIQNRTQTQKNAIKQDTVLTQQVKSETGVVDGQMYVQGDLALGAVVVKNDVPQQEAQKIANKYASELRSKYKDKKVNVQVINQEQKNLANVSM